MQVYIPLLRALTLLAPLPLLAAAPANPYLADSAWPMTHGGSFSQNSTDMPGPTDTPGFTFLEGWPVAITLAVSGPYPNGERVIWGNTREQIFKVRIDG